MVFNSPYIICIYSNFSNDEPTRVIVRSEVFLICVYWLCLHSYSIFFLFLFKKVNQYLLLMILPFLFYYIPNMFMNYTLLRYDGGVNTAYEEQYDTFFLVYFALGIIWFISLFIRKSRLI